MGGPLWANKDAQAWSIPKGLITEGEDALAAARREFFEETGFKTEGRFELLGTFCQNSKKLLTIWALEGDCNPDKLKSNLFSMVWPPKSGKLRQFPEADRGAWFSQPDAMEKIVKGQQKVLAQFFSGVAKVGS
jgi:predicted NUDIX family NTP pyrophosphohydrolase